MNPFHALTRDLTDTQELDAARRTAALARSLGWRGGWISEAEAFLARSLCVAELPTPEPEPEPVAPMPVAPLTVRRPTRYVRGRAVGWRTTTVPEPTIDLDTWGETRSERRARIAAKARPSS